MAISSVFYKSSTGRFNSPIGTSARQHLVDTDDVVGVGTNTEVETFLTRDLDEVPRKVKRLAN